MVQPMRRGGEMVGGGVEDYGGDNDKGNDELLSLTPPFSFIAA